ncbi:sugar ABC transporter substrate-binding protein [Gorillibacterium sp. sgz5001074]|uniref:sugar ABC transporter substrate-binding protein n=1 Tax=Gorillibacterium sp. sgz5001074 TaxID=3446695 RepID=UPI003F6643EE
MRLRSFPLMVLMLALLIVIAGCRSTAPPAAPSKGIEDAAAAKDRDTDPSDSYTFGILYPMANPFYENITEQMEEYAKKFHVKLIVKAPAELNLEQQVLMMENMIRQRVSAIAISPIDPVALTPLVEKAVRQGIPVICFESDILDSRRSVYIGSDHRQEGELMGELLNRQLKGKGMIMVQGGLSGLSREQLRLDGLLQYLKRNTGIQVLEVRYHEGRSEQALANLERMIDDHPHFDALVSMDLISSSTSILVWKALGLKRLALAFGMSPEVQGALSNGQVNAVISENEHLLGSRIIASLMDASSGNPISSWIDTGFREVTPLSRTP